MKKNVFFAVLAVAATLCACNREVVPAQEENLKEIQGEGLSVITARLENCSEPETRTYLDTDGTTPLWQTGDGFYMLGYYGSAGSEKEYVLSSGEGSTNATFEAASPYTGTFPYYAVYPSSLGISRTSYSQKINFTLPPTQTGSETASGQMPAFAFIQTQESLNSGISFKNVCGLFRLALTSASDVTVGKLEIIDLAGNILWGNAQYNMLNATDDPSTWVWSITEDDDQKSHLIVDYTASPVTLSSTPQYFYAAVPDGSLSGGVRVIVYGEDGTSVIDEFSSSKNLGITRSHIKPMKSVPVGYSPLDDNGTANCYVVTSAGSYKFKTVQGNSTTSVGSVASVDVLWESFGTTTTPNVGDIINNVSYTGGYVFFTTTGTAGNASIAVRDSEHKILWSWHIWVPSTEVTSDTYTNTAAATVMDRNLGALTAGENDPLSNGLVYQWGRKDPFPGLATYSAATKVATTGSFTIEATCENEASTGKGNPTYARQNPMAFLMPYSNNDWMESKDGTLWGSSKTVGDPCPPGYKVPIKDVWTDITGSAGTHATKLDGKHWYPENSYIFASTGLYPTTTSGGYFWTASAGTNASAAYKTTASSGTINNQSYFGRAAGLAVRCVKE